MFITWECFDPGYIYVIRLFTVPKEPLHGLRCDWQVTAGRNMRAGFTPPACEAKDCSILYPLLLFAQVKVSEPCSSSLIKHRLKNYTGSFMQLGWFWFVDKCHGTRLLSGVCRRIQTGLLFRFKIAQAVAREHATCFEAAEIYMIGDDRVFSGIIDSLKCFTISWSAITLLFGGRIFRQCWLSLVSLQSNHSISEWGEKKKINSLANHKLCLIRVSKWTPIHC